MLSAGVIPGGLEGRNADAGGVHQTQRARRCGHTDMDGELAVLCISAGDLCSRSRALPMCAGRQVEGTSSGQGSTRPGCSLSGWPRNASSRATTTECLNLVERSVMIYSNELLHIVTTQFRSSSDPRRVYHIRILCQVRHPDRRSAWQRYCNYLTLGKRLSHSAKTSRLTDEMPAVLFNVVQVTGVSGEGVPVTSSVNASSAQFLRLVVRQVPPVSLIENAICEGTA
jgi:hypothetical protein